MQKIERISNRILYLPPYQETDRPILAAVTGEKKTLLIDAGNSPKHANLFLKQLEEVHIKGDFLVLTHSDWDHVFGMSAIDIPVIAHYKTHEKIKRLQNLSWEDKYLDQRVKEGIEIPFCAEAIKKELGHQREVSLPIPDITFDKQMSINLGEVTVVIEHVGGDHADDCTVIYIPEEKVLFLGDCMYANLYSKKWSYTIKNTLQLVKQLEKYDADIFFLSHHDKPVYKEEFQLKINFLKETAFLTGKYKGNEKVIIKEFEKGLQRKLNAEEIETINFFVNGYCLERV